MVAPLSHDGFGPQTASSSTRTCGKPVVFAVCVGGAAETSEAPSALPRRLSEKRGSSTGQMRKRQKVYTRGLQLSRNDELRLVGSHTVLPLALDGNVIFNHGTWALHALYFARTNSF